MNDQLEVDNLPGLLGYMTRFTLLNDQFDWVN